MKKQLIIFPYNGNALEAIDAIGDNYEFIGFVDDTKEKQGLQKNGFNVYSREFLEKHKEAKVLAVPGSPTSFLKRKVIISSLNVTKDRFATVIHPHATVSPLANIGHNVLIMAGAVITSNAIIGNHVCILPNTCIHHDDEIGDYTLIGSNVTIAGFVKIKENCYIGSASSIINNIEIGTGSLIGIGSNVIKSISENSKAVGNPAKILGKIYNFHP